jgi:FAD/FMN-containing dehydrogenase
MSEQWVSRRGVLVSGALTALTGCSGGDGSVDAGQSLHSLIGNAEAAPPWAQLKRHVDGTLSLPGSAPYDRVRRLENPRYDWAEPHAVLRVANGSDVATAFKFAQDHDLPVAFRSGGHSYPGWSAGGGGNTGPKSLVLDCRGLSRVAVDGTRATIGAGASLAKVYDALGGRGRAIAGGSCATVGIAGLTLGGGVGVLSRSMGLTCDQVVAMRVVTADGRIRTVDARHDPSLFWALRGGGGGHLGMVTAFTFATHQAPAMSSFYLRWRFSAAAELIDAWQDWAPTADSRLWSTLKLLGGRGRPEPVLQVSGTWTGPASGLDAQLARLLRDVPAPIARTVQRQSYRELMERYAGCSDIPVGECHTGPGGKLRREAFGATSHIGHQPLDRDGASDLIAQVRRAQGNGLVVGGASLDALGGRVRDLDDDATAFGHRRALMTVQYYGSWDGRSGSAGIADRYVRGFREAMKPHWGLHAYVNYADPTIKSYKTAYFRGNAARLASVRKRYDPHDFFRQPQGY